MAEPHLLTALASVLPVGLLRTDLEGRCLYVNERATEMTGLTAESEMQSGWSPCVHPDDRAAVSSHVLSVLHARRPAQGEFRCMLPDGRIRWLLSQATPEHDHQGHVVGFVWTLTDTTRSQLLSERLQRSEERQAFLLRLSDALRPLSDPLDAQEVASRLLGEHLGVNRVGYADIDGRDYVIRREYTRGVAPLLDEGPRGSFGAALTEAFRRGETVVVSDVDTDPRFTESERAAMHARQVAAYVGVMLVKDTEMVAAFGVNNATPRTWTALEIALIREVAERTWDAVGRARAEEALHARQEEERNQELQLLLETATQGVASFDAQATIVTANRALEAMFGWGPGELIGQSVERLVPPSIHDVHVQHRARYFAAPGPRRMGVDREIFGQRKDGTKFPVEISLNHISTAGGGHAIAFVTDITERKRADAALHERTVELEHRTAQLSRLASDLTLAEQHAREELAKTLHDGLQQLLVTAAMNLDRLTTGRAQPQTASNELLARARGHLDEAIAAARSLSMELSPPSLHESGLPAALTWLAERTGSQYGLVVQVSADPRANSDRKDVRTLLFESVRELLFNAVKYAQVDRVTIDLSLDQDDALHIAVADQGVGFDPAGLVEQWKAGHAGWGLFSIRERLTLLGGRFEIESAPGRGTRFRLIAPRGEAQDRIDARRRMDSAATGPARDEAAGIAPARALRILLVDDHTGVRQGFRELLEARPEFHVVAEGDDGLEAIAEAHAHRPDVILMDVSMPRMDGIEATRRIRAELPFIQIIGLSSHAKTRDLQAIELAGAAAYFTKGVDTDELLDHLTAIHAAISRELLGQTNRS